ncbi:MAG: hypothetical protein GW876_01785, partial [Bacteroidetes bacterium]|nr:hypothetical protein [Bacteroidota bacterium]
DLFSRQGINTAIVGWLDFIDNDYLASLCIIKKISQQNLNYNEMINFTIENLNKTINKDI